MLKALFSPNAAIDAYQLIREAEVVSTVRKQYEYDLTEAIPSVKEIKHEARLHRISPGLKKYLANLRDLQTLLLHSEELDTSALVEGLKIAEVQRTHFGLLLQCAEEDLYELDDKPWFSNFVHYASCALPVSSALQGRVVLHWEYQDCSRPDGCQRVTNPSFAKEILHTRNFLFADTAFHYLQSRAGPIPKVDKYNLVLSTLQNILVANLAAEGTDAGTLIDSGYVPLRAMLKEFGDTYPDLKRKIQRLHKTLEDNIIAIRSIAAHIPASLLVSVIANIPFDRLAETLPEVGVEYRRLESDEFRNVLRDRRKSMQRIDKLFEDRSLFSALVKKLLS